MAEQEEPAVVENEDVEMEDGEPHLNGVETSPHLNGVEEAAPHSADLPATQSPAATPSSLPGGSSTAVDSVNLSANDDDAPMPPTKRARKHSDADRASSHQLITSPPRAAVSSMDVDGRPRQSTFSVAQHKFAVSTIRTLKKLKDAGPFKLPVDAEALKIPHYHQVVTHPMDFSTIERKLAATNPIKPDPNPSVERYYNADEFIADVRLIFSNCVTFNGAEHFVTLQGKRVEAVFDKQIKQLPAPEEPKPIPVKKPATPPPPPPPPVAIPKKAPRRQSTSVPVIRRSDTENIGRPKREIHPPPPKDLPYADAPKKQRKRAVKKDGTSDQLRFCGKLLDQLSRKQNSHVVLPFADPVDWVRLQIPDYPRIVKKPMDLSTMRRKLDAGEYPTSDKFRDDFKLIISNCFLYNAVGTPVNQAGLELQRIFDEKWKGLPPLHAESEDEEEEEESDDDTRAAILAMESQIETMRNSLVALKQNKTEKKKKQPKKKDLPPPVASSSKPPKKESKTAPKKKTVGKKAQITDDDVLSFEQKKDLSEAIQTLDGSKLEKVIQIIHEGVPEIRDSQEEIELEIDTLPSAVLTKLYNFVLRPLRQPPAKRPRTGKGTGTGGLKRKSMDEDQEAEKIKALEERMKLFQEPNGASQAPVAPAEQAGHDSDHSSDSSSDDESSGSESE
ncbi:Bromodomain-containing protein [Artomyces pyxidatus]|uniref:Bromodomain-containing protein n=1 Tax=Artomyces pyxidatus TaxID=48021 RepID=A0ACB8THI0_9AGAM|nr:Bromodomain-containing protein [Artomyces pyxidatus]